MRLWNVVVRAKRTVEVEAETEEEAIDLALERVLDPEYEFGSYAEPIEAWEVSE